MTEGEEGKKNKQRELEVACLQMARVGVYWQEQQNISAVSSGTQTTDCDWPDHSQEWKDGSLRYNRGWRESKRDPQQVWLCSPRNWWLNVLLLLKRRHHQNKDVMERSLGF